jgi:hypothetical protein
MLLFILHDDQIAKQMKMTNSLKFCHFGWQNPKPKWEWIKAWMVVDFTWSNAEKWIWKKALNNVVLDDKIQKA